jgi:hypothetical protein
MLPREGSRWRPDKPRSASVAGGQPTSFQRQIIDDNAIISGRAIVGALPVDGGMVSRQWTNAKQKFRLQDFIPCIALVLVSEACPLHAQDKIENGETGFFVQTSGGVPAICGFEFTLIYRDRTYQRGRLSGVTGSLSWAEANGNLVAMLKIIGSDFPNAANLNMTPKAFPVLKGFVAVDGKAYPPNPYPCDTPTDFCAAYWSPSSVALYTALMSKSLTIGFSRERNGLDITLPLDVRGGVTRTPDEYRAFGQCILAVVDRAKSNLSK